MKRLQFGCSCSTFNIQHSTFNIQHSTLWLHSLGGGGFRVFSPACKRLPRGFAPVEESFHAVLFCNCKLLHPPVPLSYFPDAASNPARFSASNQSFLPKTFSSRSSLQCAEAAFEGVLKPRSVAVDL